MKPFALVLAVGFALAACAQSTSTDPDLDAVDAEVATESAPAVDDAITGEPPVETTPPDDADVESDTAEAETADTSPPTTEPPTDTTPAAAPEAAAPASAFDGVATFYVGSGFDEQPWAPVGWWDGSSWAQQTFDESGLVTPVPEPSLTQVSATSLDLGDGASAVIDGLALGPSQEYCVGTEVGPLIEIGVEVPDTPSSLGYDVIAVTADWPLQPRPVRQVGLEAPVYSTVGAALFAPVADASTTGEVLQVVRVDLDGDTIEEVLVTFENITSSFGAAGDFTGVYARYPEADGTVVDELVVGYIPEEPDGFPTFGRHTIGAVADLNGDGVMEVVVRDSFWEYGGVTVYAFEDGRLTPVAAGGCGI